MVETEKIDRAMAVIENILDNIQGHERLRIEQLNYKLNMIRVILQDLANTLRS